MSLKRKSEDFLETNGHEVATSSKSKKKKYVQIIEEEDDDEKINVSQESVDIDIPLEAEVGVIEKVCVENFMCHTKLEVRLGPHVNFIIGRNGSGKSAILTGIIVGLGGKAMMTHRGNSLKGFIKEGCSFCNVSVTLRNRGTDAYKPEDYGRESIIVERRLTRDGSGTYKIRNGTTKKIVSSRRDELVGILDQFNIQIDNPVSILTQDTARSFLNTSNASDKYSLFLKATQLEQMSSNYQQIQEDKNINKEIISRKMKVIEELYNLVKELEEKYKDMQKLQEMKGSIGSLNKKLAWAIVNEKKQETDEAEKGIDKYVKKVPNYEKKLDDTKEKEQVAMKESEQKREEVLLATEETQSFGNEKTILEANVRKSKQLLKYAQESRRKLDKEIYNTEKNKKILQEKINELKSTAQRDIEAEQMERNQQIESKQQDVRQIEAQLSTSNHHMNQVSEAIKRAQERKYHCNRDMGDAKKHVDDFKRKITQLQEREKNNLLAYGGGTSNIIKDIEYHASRGKFHKKPLGPLGSLIKLKDPRWAIAVEQCLKGSISSYACHNNHDMLILKSIIKKHKNNKDSLPTMIVSSFSDHLYDVSRYKPKGYTAVMDMLIIDNHVVANTLIDQCRIENTLLIEDPKKAQKVIWQDNPPATKAISIQGHEIIGGRSSMYYPCKITDARYLQADVQSSIRKAEHDLQAAQKNAQNVNQEIKTIEVELRRHKDELDKVKRKCMHEQDQLNNIQAEIQDLMNIEIEQPPDVTVLENEVDEYERNLEILKKNASEENLMVDQKKDELRQEMTIFQEYEQKCNAAIEKLEKIADEDVACQGVLSKLKNDRKYYQDKLEELQKHIKDLKEHHENLVKDYELNRSQALQFCKGEEIEVTEAPKKLKIEITQIQKRIEREESRRGNSDEIIEQYNNGLKKYNETKESIKNLKYYNKSIEKALNRRAKRYEKFQQALSLRSKRYFDMMLSHRGYCGKMRINHDEETLSVEVNVENAKGATTKDSKALSGGERSFSTICFIMSMWEAMEAPFRCLDEFDVFMDMLNRRIAMKLLMEIAQQQQGRQFILLTPQDMSNIAGNERVRIFKLNDPERGQQTLPFEPIDSS